MRFDLVTLFPKFFEGPLHFGVLERALREAKLTVELHDLRAFTHDRHRTVDDRPFGGGEGMVLKAEPIFLAVESIWPERKAGQRIVLLSAGGKLFDQSIANELSRYDELLLICGRYEGVDERFLQALRVPQRTATADPLHHIEVHLRALVEVGGKV